MFIRGCLLIGLLVAGVRAESPFAGALAGRDDGDRAAIVGGGYEALLLRVHLIREAKTSIAVQTFIWKNDECGRLIMYELLQAARRGVKVRVIADHLFSAQDPDVVAFLATAHPNLEIKHYRPTLSRIKPGLARTLVASVKSFRRINQRMHNKILLVDEAVLVTGGRNIENAYFDHSTELNFRDRDVVASGPVAKEAAKSFDTYWNFKHAVASRDLVDVAAAIERGEFRRFDGAEDFGFSELLGNIVREADDAVAVERRFAGRLKAVRRAMFVADEPGKKRGMIFGPAARLTRDLTRTVGEARERIVIQTPYLVLSERARALFRKLREKRPDLQIDISTNSFASTDNILAYSANYRLRNRYVQDLGLQVREYKPEPAIIDEVFPLRGRMAALAAPRLAAGEQRRGPYLCIHAKSLVIDDRVAFVGSYNLDPRSENLNTEVGLLIEDEHFAAELRSEIERDMRPENSWVIARRALPLRLETVNAWVGGILSLSPVDLWPIQNTSSFELRSGFEAVPAGHPEFHQRYEEVGAFPGTEGLFTQKEIMTRLYKAVGTPLTPIL